MRDYDYDENPSKAVTLSAFAVGMGGLVAIAWYFWMKNKLRLQVEGISDELDVDESEETASGKTIAVEADDESAEGVEVTNVTTTKKQSGTTPAVPAKIPTGSALPIPMPPLDEDDQYIRAMDWLDSRKASVWFALPEEDPFLDVRRRPPEYYKPNTKVKALRSDAPAPIAVGTKADPTVAAYLTKMDDYLRANGVVVDNNINAWSLTVMRNLKGLSWPAEADKHPCAIPDFSLWGNIIPSIYMLRVIEQIAGPIVKVYNGFRSPEYDAAVGEGALNSGHVWFSAIDFTPSNKTGAPLAAKQLYNDKQFLFQSAYNQYPSGNMHIDTFFKHRCCWSK